MREIIHIEQTSILIAVLTDGLGKPIAPKDPAAAAALDCCTTGG